MIIDLHSIAYGRRKEYSLGNATDAKVPDGAASALLMLRSVLSKGGKNNHEFTEHSGVGISSFTDIVPKIAT